MPPYSINKSSQYTVISDTSEKADTETSTSGSEIRL